MEATIEKAEIKPRRGRKPKEIISMPKTEKVSETTLVATKKAISEGNGELQGFTSEEYGSLNEFKSRLEYEAKALEFLREAVKSQLRETVDYGVIPGTPKPSLWKPGAEKIANFLGLVPDYIPTGEGKIEGDLIIREYKCVLTSKKTGKVMGSCIGSCNSYESKFKFRWLKLHDLPQEIRWKIKTERAIAKSGHEYDKVISSPVPYKWGKFGTTFKVNNENPYDLLNTIDKMAQKRCLSYNTPLVFRTDRGIVRGNVGGLYETFQKSKNPIYLPSADGGWRKLENVIKQDKTVLFKICLRDGSYIRATADHRFPTTFGLKEVKELRIGDRFLRTQINIPHQNGGTKELGWFVGLCLAEGFNSRHSVRLTLHSKEMDFVERIKQTLDLVGVNVGILKKKGENALQVDAYGKAAQGIFEHFIDGENSHTKHPSKNSWRQNIGFLEGVLEGYLDGDGSLTIRNGRFPYWRIGFTGNNYELCEDLRTLCGILGKKVLIKNSTAKCNGKVFKTKVGWVKEKKVTYNQACLEEIVKISEEIKQECPYDVQVDGDHLFCLANGIQTHNSFVGAVINASRLSIDFSQDLEDLPKDQLPKENENEENEKAE